MRHLFSALAIAVTGAVLGAACKDRTPITGDVSPEDAAARAVPAPASPPSPAPLASDSPVCKPQLDAIRALRHGPQPCSKPEDCTVWMNGQYWDGCPNETTVANIAKLDALKKAYEAAGCSVTTNARCAAYEIRGCVKGTCGGF